jgi:hypothetical protein
MKVHKIVYIIDGGEDIYFMKIDEFLVDQFLENVGFSPINVESCAILQDLTQPRVIFADSENRLLNWNVKFLMRHE